MVAAGSTSVCSRPRTACRRGAAWPTTAALAGCQPSVPLAAIPGSAPGAARRAPPGRRWLRRGVGKRQRTVEANCAEPQRWRPNSMPLRGSSRCSRRWRRLVAIVTLVIASFTLLSNAVSEKLDRLGRREIDAPPRSRPVARASGSRWPGSSPGIPRKGGKARSASAGAGRCRPRRAGDTPPPACNTAPPRTRSPSPTDWR